MKPLKNNSKTKIKTALALKRALSKKSGVVFTNGCFDILHPGHIEYLEEAKRQGKCLVVALNSDASVARLKGPGRPIHSLNDRMRVIAGLGCVDFVTHFTQDTPLQLIQMLGRSIRVLVKGGDWTTDQIVGASDVLSWGGQVKSLHFIEGKSTTASLAKLRRLERP